MPSLFTTFVPPSSPLNTTEKPSESGDKITVQTVPTLVAKLTKELRNLLVRSLAN